MSNFMIVDAGRYETIVTTVDESSGRMGFLRINEDMSSLARDIIYNLVKDMGTKKIYIDTNGYGKGIYDHLIQIEQDRVEIIPLRGGRLVIRVPMN